MYNIEYEASEQEVLSLFLEAVHDESNSELRELIIDPIISVIEKPSNRNKYIEYGNTFLEANAEMLSKEYPTKPVSFPKRYIDNVFALFGFEMEEFKQIIKKLISKHVSSTNSFATILNNPSNVIHIIVLYYSDMILNRKLRDSARQQLGLSIYNNLYRYKYFKTGTVESIMAYTYSQLNSTWGLVRAENMITWICNNVDTSYAFWRTKLSLDMSIEVLVNTLNRIRDSLNQVMRHLSNRYYANVKDNANIVGDDVKADEEYLVTNNFTTIRENLIRLIKNGDTLYKSKSSIYTGIAKIKNIKLDTLYEYSQKVAYKDLERIIDTILYVFLVRDGNKVSDINSSKYISKITNMPTQVDRAIQGKPLILPLSEKYKTKSEIVRAHICLVATFILHRINDVI